MGEQGGVSYTSVRVQKLASLGRSLNQAVLLLRLELVSLKKLSNAMVAGAARMLKMAMSRTL